MYDLATAPIRAITRRIHQDLGTFCGATRNHITATTAALWVACAFVRSPYLWFPAAIVAVLLYTTVAALDRQRTTVEGPNREGDPSFWGLAAVFFWMTVLAIPMGADPVATVGGFAAALFIGSLAYNDDDDDDHGTPYVVRAWRTLKSLTPTPTPTPTPA